MSPRVLRTVCWLTVAVLLTGGSGGACSDREPERRGLQPPLLPVPRRPRSEESKQALGSWGPVEDGLACRLVEIRPPGRQPYLAMQIRNLTDADRTLANELPMGRPSGSYSMLVETNTGTAWTPVTDPSGQIIPLDESPGAGIGGRLRVPAQGFAEQRIVEFWVPTGGRSPIGPQGERGTVLHVRGELRWFDWQQGYRKGNHRASCPPLVTRWVRWR